MTVILRSSASLYTERTRASEFDWAVCHQTGYHAKIVRQEYGAFPKKKKRVIAGV